MKLLNLDKAVVPFEKVSGYLLNPEHPEGREKCEFFTRFGFSQAQWETLAFSLLDHAARHDVAKIEATKYGTRYVIEGAIRSPDKRNPAVRSVWFVRSGEDFPRLVTAYRLTKKVQR